MGRARKSKTSKRDKYASFADMADESDEDADLPKDEAGRRKIKRQYGELLGIRIEKLRGQNSESRAHQQDDRGHLLHLRVVHEGLPLTRRRLHRRSRNQNNMCAACTKFAGCRDRCCVAAPRPRKALANRRAAQPEHTRKRAAAS